MKLEVVSLSHETFYRVRWDYFHLTLYSGLTNTNLVFKYELAKILKVYRSLSEFWLNYPFDHHTKLAYQLYPFLTIKVPIKLLKETIDRDIFSRNIYEDYFKEKFFIAFMDLGVKKWKWIANPQHSKTLLWLCKWFCLLSTRKCELEIWL